MMGAGKSSVGRFVAQHTDRPFVDTDMLIQHRFGRTISQVFQLYGEDAFRDHETSVLRELKPKTSVISTGGGIVMRPENWVEMRRLGSIVYLKASVEVLTARLEASKKKRPLLQAEDWRQRLSDLLEARRPLYEQADHVFEVNYSDIESAGLSLAKILKENAGE
jgi:shikimate kinase